MGRHRLILIIGLVAALALAGAFGYGLWRNRTVPGDPDDAAQVARGAKVYADNCASCHGAHLEGQPDWRRRLPDGRNPAPPHDFRGHTWRHPDDELFGMVKRGFAAYAPPGYKTDMMGFGDVLSDAQIWDAIAFIKHSWPVEFRTYQRRLTEGAVPRGGPMHDMNMTMPEAKPAR